MVFSNYSKCLRIWLYMLLGINILNIPLNATLNPGSDAYASLLVFTMTSVILSYAIGIFIFMNYKTINEYSSLVEEKPFHQWILFGAIESEKYLMIILGFIWFVAGLVHLFLMSGYGYFVGICFYLPSVLFWSLIIYKYVKSINSHPIEFV